MHTTVVQPFDPVATNLQMLEAVPTPLFLLSSQGIVLYANPAGSQWMGLPADLLHGRLLLS